MKRDKDTLQANIEADIPDNTSRLVSPADVRQNLLDITDSVPVLSGVFSDGALLKYDETNDSFIVAQSGTDYISPLQANEPNGYVGLDSSGVAIATLIPSSYSAVDISGVIGPSGMMAFNLDSRQLVRFDGETPGGVPYGGGLGPVVTTGFNKEPVSYWPAEGQTVGELVESVIAASPPDTEVHIYGHARISGNLAKNGITVVNHGYIYHASGGAPFHVTQSMSVSLFNFGTIDSSSDSDPAVIIDAAGANVRLFGSGDYVGSTAVACLIEEAFRVEIHGGVFSGTSLAAPDIVINGGTVNISPAVSAKIEGTFNPMPFLGRNPNTAFQSLINANLTGLAKFN